MQKMTLINNIFLFVSFAVIAVSLFFRIKNYRQNNEKPLKDTKPTGNQNKNNKRNKFNKNNKYSKNMKGKKTEPVTIAEPIVKKEVFTRPECLIFAAIMLVSFIIRVWQFGQIPGGMNQDGAMAAVDAKALADYGTDRYGMHMPIHFTAWGYGQMSTFLSYCMVPFIKLFGLSATTARLPILIASMCGLAALYFIIRRIFGIRAAQIVLILASCNPWHFIQSRWALDCNMLPHMFIIGLLFLLMGLEKKRRYLYISMIFFAFCMYCYGIAFYTIPLFLVFICIYILAKKQIKWTEALISAGIYLLVSWPIYLTMAINTFKWETIKTPFFTMAYFPDSMRSQDILFFSDDVAGQLERNIKALTRIFTKGDSLLWNSIDGYGVINICFVPLIFLGLYYVIHLLIKEKDNLKKIGYMSIIAFFFMGIVAGLITAEVNVNRINILLYTFIILAGIGIYFIYKNVKMLSFVYAPVYLILSIMLISRYFTSYADEIKGIFFNGFVDAVQHIDENSNCAYHVITPDSQFEGAWNVSEIMTLYAQEIDAEYYQGKYKDDNGLLYNEKYLYYNAADINAQNPISPDDPVAYVITPEDLGLFSPDEYVITEFNHFYSAIPIENYL